jgi:AcrR family transcriptional regulator
VGAIEMLDAEGESGLTLRGLAARLGGGVGSLYWYVRSKEQLLDLATDAVIGQVMDDIDASHFPETDDIPTRLASLREIGLVLFHHLEAHPWAASYLLRDSDAQPNSLRYFDMVGRQLIPLGLTNRQMFYGVSGLINYVVGMGAQMKTRRIPLGPDGQPLGRDEYFEETVARWADLDRDAYPFMHRMIGEFRDHDDLEQFTAGLDLIIDGLRRQGEASRS